MFEAASTELFNSMSEDSSMVSMLRNALWRYDIIGWLLVMVFFMGSAIANGKPVTMAMIGALAIIGLMFLVGLSVEVLIEGIKHLRGLGTITGLLTNGPEALIVIVGLVQGDILFANSTPLGSNFVNPLVLASATLLLGSFTKTLSNHLGYCLVSLALTMIMAGSFFFIPKSLYIVWVVVVAVISLILFFKRPVEADEEVDTENHLSRFWSIPALIVLVGAGYLLDPVVAFTSKASAAPKGMIGFIVLSFLSSWPEFKTIFALVNRQKYSAGILNTIVSNIINLWLAIGGLIVYLLLG